MAAVLPLFPLFLLFYIFYQKNSRGLAAVKSYVTWGVLCVVSAEALSLARGLTAWNVAFFWAAVNLALMYGCLRFRQRIGWDDIRDFWEPLLRHPAYWGIGLIFTVTFALALFTPPNNTDAMVYHLPRIEHWIADQSLQHYVTVTERQLWTPPGAEILIMHLRILTPGIELANGIQWMAMVMSVIGMAQVAGFMGFGPGGRRLTALFCATLPMGILQTASTQNDYVAASWLVCCMVFVLLGRQRMTAEKSVWTGLALGLALLTKGVAYFFAAGLLGLVFWRKGSSQRWPKRLTCALLILMIAAGFQAGHMRRNIRLGGNPLDPFASAPFYRNGMMNAKLFAANFIRHIAMHTGWHPGMISAIEEGVAKLDGLLGVQDTVKHISYNEEPFAFYAWHFNEDVEGNPIHFLLLIIGGTLIIFNRKIFIEVWPYGIALAASGIIFLWVSRWQPWVTRFHLPFFILGAPLAIGAFQKRRAALVVGIICMGVAVPYLLWNESKSFLGQESVFFKSYNDIQFKRAKDIQRGFVRGTAWICRQGCPEDIGLLLPPGEWEYPLWRLMKQCRTDVRLQDVASGNISQKYRAGAYAPEMIMASNSDHRLDFKTRLFQDGHWYIRVSTFSPIIIFKRDDSGKLEQDNFLFQLHQALDYASLESLWNDRKHVERILDGLDQAKNVDIVILEKAFPGFGKSYVDVFLPALQRRAVGLLAGNPLLYQQAQRQLRSWVSHFVHYRSR